MSLNPLDLALLLAAAFLGGTLNAVAGGGSFLTLPALVYTGLPAVVANATGTVALLPGYVASAIACRRDIEPPPKLSLAALAVLCLAGGAIGASLLLVTGASTFRALVPWLLLLATALFAFAPMILTSFRGKAGSPVAAGAGVLLVGIYGGYFNGGLGIVLLALFGLLGVTRLNAANGLKNLASVLLTSIAVAVYAWGGLVAWRQALLMMLAATAGGYFGASVARRIPAPWLRTAIVAIGLSMSALFFGR